MATILVPGEIVRARWYCFYDSQIAINQMFYECVNAVGSSATDQVAAARLDLLAASVYPAILPNVANYLGASVQIVAGTLYPLVTSNANAVAGADGSAPLPTQNCGIITKNVLAAGKGRKGRLYMPFPTVAFNAANDRPTLAYQANMGTWAATLVTGAITVGGGGNTIDLVPIVYNPADPAKKTNIIGATVKPLWATQRRRGDYGRTNLPFP